MRKTVFFGAKFIMFFSQFISGTFHQQSNVYQVVSPYIAVKMTDGWMDEMCSATQWAFADGLEVNQKVVSETIGLANLILRQVARPSFC